ncbi:4-aminobutyrate--2-oxoglutarate transaminase [Anaerolineales bacterium HSG6]|nr:4-aminobutyrate--2-oxoglutarate transaminase [Anaerolineales bacterium HSG6]MDM8531103.1 4-aminobutyrate--2-oxoglutarate transaminase [Anaerolineales bacterium HSG25]
MSSINIITDLPGPKSLELVARREAATSRGAAKLTQIAVTKAEGATVTDVDGNTLLDFAGGIGTLAVGHCPPSVVSALQNQAESLIHMCAIVGSYEPYIQVAELLNEITLGDHAKKSVLTNSGAEAVEAAVKIARAHTGRQGIIVFEGAYHGRTNMTMAMTSKYALFKKGFGPFAPEVYRLPFPNLYRRPPEMSEEGFVEYAIQQLENALIAQVDPSAVAAIVIEPVQGEGGFLPTPPRFMQKIRELCDQHGIVMIADEVQCGFARTGKLFAMEHYNIVPDLMTTGKSLAGGMPLAAVTGRAEIMDAPHPGGLGGTYSGNPLACVAAVEAITMMRQPEFLARAQAVGARFWEHLQHIQRQADNKLVGDIRGLGPMLVMELVKGRDTKQPAMEETARVTQETFKQGLITIRAGLYSNCVRFLPPLNITDDQIDEGMAIVADAVRTVSRER